MTLVLMVVDDVVVVVLVVDGALLSAPPMYSNGEAPVFAPPPTGFPLHDVVPGQYKK